MPESYQPGSRRPIYGQNHKITENRFAWVNCEAGKYLILVGNDEGHGQDVVLFHPRPGKQPDVAMKLTDLTIEELDALQELFATAMAWARPVVERRDKEAKDAWDQGDDSHSRNYRPLPVVVYRKRPELQHDEGVQQRPAGVPEGGGDAGSPDSGGVRGAGDELAEPEQDGRESEDDCTQAD